MLYSSISFISIHALREESDLPKAAAFVVVFSFQSTLSVRRATADNVTDTPFVSLISIHALREESDIAALDSFVINWDFNPRSP